MKALMGRCGKVNVELAVFLITHQAMKKYGGVEI
jgi:hypothetical protein